MGTIPARDGFRVEEYRMEIENRIRNLFWTISGDYSLKIRPDADTFALSKSLALYDAIKQGAFSRHFDHDRLAMYILQKRSCGADETALIELMQLCTDAAAYPPVRTERSGIPEIRRQAFEDYLRIFPDEGDVSTVTALRRTLIRRALDMPYTCTPLQEDMIRRIDALEQAKDTDEIIRTIDELYNALPDAELYHPREPLEKILNIPPEALVEYAQRELTDDQIQTVLDGYMDALKQEMLRMNRKGAPHRRFVYDPGQDAQSEETEPDPDSVEKVRAYMERNFGKSALATLECEKLNHRLCRDIHRNCTLHLTAGILSTPALKNTQYLRGQMQHMKNQLYFHAKENPIRKNVTILASMLRQVQVMRQDEESSRAVSGELMPERLWKIGRTDDIKLFDAKKKHSDTNYVVDLLIDSSSSQVTRQPQIAAQGYIISQALSAVNIPHRICSFCSYWDHTIIHRFRNYDDPASENENILQFSAFGENRDGLAIRTICDELDRRTEDNKILIILSDGRPSHIGTTRAGCRRTVPYVGEDAVRDTAIEVRRARNRGISVLGVFIGDEESLAAEKRIFGKEFTYTKNIRSFSRIVGNYLRKQMERD